MDKFFEYKNKRINYRTSGVGSCIVLLHGFLESLKIWDDFTNELSKNFKVLSIDLPGHGKTDNFFDVHTMGFMAETVKEVLDHLNIEKCTMVGHSMGGYVTLAFAEQYPKIINGFCLFHSQAAADSLEARQNRERTIKIIQENKKGFIQHFIPDLFSPANRSIFRKEIDSLKKQACEASKEGIIAALEGMKIRTDKTNILQSFKKPIMYIIGKDDTRIPTDLALAQCAIPDHCTVHILGGVGHMGYTEAKEDTITDVRNFSHHCS